MITTPYYCEKIVKKSDTGFLFPSQGWVARGLIVASTTPAWPPPRSEASALPSSPASPVRGPNLDGVLRGTLVYPPWPRNLQPLLLALWPEAILRPLPLLVRGLRSLPADQVGYPPIPFWQEVYLVWTLQLEAGLIPRRAPPYLGCVPSGSWSR